MDKGNITITGHSVQVFPVDGNVWLTQHEIARLFGCFVSKVGSNIRSILKSGVFRDDEVCRLQACGGNSFVELYNLRMIIALSFRIRSYEADLFRDWLMEKCTGSTSDDLIFKFIRQFEDTDSN